MAMKGLEKLIKWSGTKKPYEKTREVKVMTLTFLVFPKKSKS
jgi:hypothetical protein